MLKSYNSNSPARPPESSATANRARASAVFQSPDQSWRNSTGAAGSSGPEDTLLPGCLREPRLRLRQPLAIKFCRQEGQVIAEAVELNGFEAGADPSAALVDLRHAIAELYRSLNAEQHRLAPAWKGSGQCCGKSSCLGSSKPC